MLKNDAASAAVAFSAAYLPPPDLCQKCGTRPRAAAGKLTRCLPCVKRDAEAARLEREAFQAAYLAKAEADCAAKKCRTCRSEKPITQFDRWRSATDGLRRDCRACVRTGKVKRPKPMTPEQIEADRVRRQAPHRRAANVASVLAWMKRNPDAVAAKLVARKAVKRGEIKVPTVCQVKGCRTKANLEGHHVSYARKFRKRLVHVCPKHHRRLHQGEQLALKRGAQFKTAKAPPTK